MPSVSIIGVGRVGGALALALSAAGYEVENLVHRDSATAEAISSKISNARLFRFDSALKIDSDIVLIATADPDIPAAAKRLSTILDRRPVVLHTSGSLGSDVLTDLAAIGCSVGSMHPLISVSDAIAGSASFGNAYFCIEGDEKAVEAASAMVKSLGGRSFSIPSGQKPLYHAAAVTACGHLVAVIDIAIEMLAKCGLNEATAKDILMPLIESTILNLSERTPSEALTGSFARADLGAVERHLAAIDGTMSNDVRAVYLLLGERSLALAASNGVDAASIQKLRERIQIAKRKPEC